MTPTQAIDAQLAALPDWRGERLAKFRALVHTNAPHLSEEFKWGTGMFADGKRLVCGFAAFKSHVKFNFFDGANLPDPHGLFNNGFEAKTARSIDLKESDPFDEVGIAELIRAANLDTIKH